MLIGEHGLAHFLKGDGVRSGLDNDLKVEPIVVLGLPDLHSRGEELILLGGLLPDGKGEVMQILMPELNESNELINRG